MRRVGSSPRSALQSIVHRLRADLWPVTERSPRFSRMPLHVLRAIPLSAVPFLSLVSPSTGSAQVGEDPNDTAAVVVDSTDLVSVGRAAQALFERGRQRHLPLSFETGSGSCDERVGRFCTWYAEGEWFPVPEKIEIVELRTELLEQLDTLQQHLPGSSWLLGQRVWYRSEGGDWLAALRSARTCGAVDLWWCKALEGFALHGLGQYEAAEAAFDEALELMDPERAEEWRLPERAVDSNGRDLLEDLRGLPADSSRRVLDRLWTLADPLYLVGGNDRLTAHYARWTVATLRERARNPFRISWGSDLEALTIRHGWEMGWERSPRPDYSGVDHIIGHKHPEGRDYMPSGDVLADPATATPEDLLADRRRPRSLYAPVYAPVLLPMEGQIVVFPRGDEMVLVSTHSLPDDTTFHAGHSHDLPWLDPGDQGDMVDRTGLFAVPVGGAPTQASTEMNRADGALTLTVPAGSYVVSAETWSPRLRRAGRLRMGVVERRAPEDIATLSDLLLLRPMAVEPLLLEAALAAALPRPQIRPGQTFAIAWEVAGLGFRPETLQFEVSVERTRRSVFRRIGEFVGLADRPQPLALSWEEAGPDRPTHFFRYLDLDLPHLDPGHYVIRLVLRTANRSEAISEQRFEVRERE